MTVTRLGWDVRAASSARLVPSNWITGKQRKPDHQVVLDYVCRRWNVDVEKIKRSWSWGWNDRSVRGYAGIPSEHCAGTALDLNAPAHGLGVRGTFSDAQVDAIHRILADVSYSVRWGGDYRHAYGDPRRPITNPTARVDEMHIELQGGNALVSRVAEQIRAGQLPEPGGKKPAAKPKKNADAKASLKPKPAPKEEDYMRLAATKTRYKNQTIQPGRSKTLELDEKGGVTLTSLAHGQEYRAHAQVYATGLLEGEVLELRWIIVDYKKGQKTKVLYEFPYKHLNGRPHGVLVADDVLVAASRLTKKVAKGHSMRLRLYATNKGSQPVAVTQLRTTAETN